MTSPRYQVRPIADENCDALNPDDETIIATDALEEARAAASSASLPYGAGILDTATGLIDVGFGFGVAAAEPDAEGYRESEMGEAAHRD